MKESVEKYGTVAFDHGLMCEMIGWGTVGLDADGYYVLKRELKPTNLSFALWLMIVPKVYRDEVVAITKVVGKRYLGKPATKKMLDTIVAETRDKIWAEVEPVPPRDCGY